MSDFDVRSTFVSVVDHLPSDIIRKLWLIQTLNINYESLKNELDLLLKEINQPDIPRESYFQKVSTMVELSNSLRRIRLESLQESKSISSTIKITKLNLENQYNQLQQDQKTYQQELRNNDKAAIKHVERTNRRTSTKKPIKLKITLNKKERERPSTILRIQKPRGRGRPPKTATSTPTSSKIKKPLESLKVDEDDEIYCLCRRGSYGEMIACDNPKCKYEWFHYNCVGLTRAPRGRWNCPLCKNRKQ